MCEKYRFIPYDPADLQEPSTIELQKAYLLESARYLSGRQEAKTKLYALSKLIPLSCVAVVTETGTAYYCPACGEEVENGAYCSECGQRVTMTDSDEAVQLLPYALTG